MLPRLEDYDISPLTGFVPEQFPLEKLPNSYYEPWEALVESLPSLILNKTIRTVIDTRLELLSTDRLETVREYRRAYSVLGFLSHAYVWGYNEQPSKVLPSQLAVPFKEVSAKLELPPVATYAGLVLWNFRPALRILATDKVATMAPDNFTTINTFTGSIDESWFYLVSCHFEIEGAKCLNMGMKTLQAAFDHDVVAVNLGLQELAQLIDNLGTVMMSMEQICDPHVFYFRIRPFLAGWKNMSEFGLPGLIYGEGEPVSYAGGSNAQSSLIQYLDTLLNVEHYPTGVRPRKHTDSSDSTLQLTKSTINSDSKNFNAEMQSYMPKLHRQFLQDLTEYSILNKFVATNSKNYPELILSYDACLAMLKSFRDKHIQIVTRYIILPSKSASSSSTLRAGLASKKTIAENRGTGGTSLLPFLKQCRDETGDPAAGSWGRRILTGGILNLKYTQKSPKADDNSGHW